MRPDALGLDWFAVLKPEDLLGVGSWAFVMVESDDDLITRSRSGWFGFGDSDPLTGAESLGLVGFHFWGVQAVGVQGLNFLEGSGV